MTRVNPYNAGYFLYYKITPQFLSKYSQEFSYKHQHDASMVENSVDHDQLAFHFVKKGKQIHTNMS